MTAVLPLEKMTLAQKLQAMEELWADLSCGDKLESPAWHEQILQRRSKENEFVDWETAKNELRARLK